MSRKIQTLKKLFIPFLFIAILLFPLGSSAFALPTDQLAAPTTIVATTSPTPTDTCNSSGGPLAWLICAVINIISGGESALEGAIDSLLQTSPLVFTSQKCAPSDTPQQCSNKKFSYTIFSVWSKFRLYGDVILVIALLVVIVAEAAGGGVFEAYNVRKVLPRILVAAVMINLSIYLVSIAMDVVNILGAGIQNMIEAPFLQAGGAAMQKIHVSGGTGAAFSLGLGALTFAGISSATIGVVFLTLLSAFLVVLGILFTLVIRQGLIVFLIIVSPVAFSLYCLPNTEKYFKKWWDLLSKTLLVYPIVSIVFAMAYISGVVVSNFGLHPQIIAQTIAIIAVVAPLFLIPFAFKIAGGAIGQIHGVVTGVHARGRKTLMGHASRMAKQQFSETRNYGRFSDRNKLTRGINTALGATTNPIRDLRHGKSGVYAGRETSRLVQGQANLKEDRTFQAHQNDDSFLLAVANRELAEKKLAAARTKLSTATTVDDQNRYQAEINARENGLSLANQVSSRRSAGTQLQALQALARTGYQFNDEDGEEAYKELSTTVRGLVGNDSAAYASTMNTMQYNLKEAGRYELGGINNGAGYNPAAGLDKADPYSLAVRGKPAAIKAKKKLMTDALQAGNFEQAEIHRLELRNVAQNATGSNQKEALKALAEHDSVLATVNPATGNTYEADRKAYLTAPVVGAPPKMDKEQFVRGVSTGWLPVDETRGFRYVERPTTNLDVASEKARGFQRPDPSQL